MSIQRFLKIEMTGGSTREFNELDGYALEYSVGEQGDLVIEYLPIAFLAEGGISFPSEGDADIRSISGPPDKYLSATINSCDWMMVSWDSRQVAEMKVIR